ncbi:hypothetical protein BC940DRAFT_4271 [Gongronella butleri]|nr:hypothetical protein BC940DRAFT_4271 [Gongronella butleri]
MRAHASTTPLNRLKKHWKRTKAAGVHYFFFFFWCLGASCCLALSSFFISLMAMGAHPWARIMLLPDILCPVIFFSQGHASIWALDTTQHTVKTPEIDENNRYLLYFVFLMAIAR